MHKPFIIMLSLMFLYGCATPQISIQRKPGVDFSKYKKVAVIKFDCRNPIVGQEVSDRIALSFMKKGYNVVERSQLKSIIDENAITASGLTEANRAALKLGGVDASVIGTVTRYDCEQSKDAVTTKGRTRVTTKNLCHVSISLKMLNVQTGDILWGGQGSYSLRRSNMTAGRILEKLIEKMEAEIP
jgi:curli biogenesis system outer membrane secretion channel CsgG